MANSAAMPTLSAARRSRASSRRSRNAARTAVPRTVPQPTTVTGDAAGRGWTATPAKPGAGNASSGSSGAPPRNTGHRRDPSHEDTVLHVTDDGEIPPAPPASDPTDRAAHVFALVGSWMFSEPMTQLLDAFGEGMPAAEGWLHLGEDLPEWLDPVLNDSITGIEGLSAAQTDILRRVLAVERMTADHFNFRGDGPQYRERSQAMSGDFEPELRERILELTDRLGLVSPRHPRYRHYDKTLVLGGGHRSPLLRPRYAAQLQAEGVDLGELSFLGSPRFLVEEPPERAVTDLYAPGAVDELDLMISGARAPFAPAPTHITYLSRSPSAQLP